MKSLAESLFTEHITRIDSIPFKDSEISEFINTDYLNYYDETAKCNVYLSSNTKGHPSPMEKSAWEKLSLQNQIDIFNIAIEYINILGKNAENLDNLTLGVPSTANRWWRGPEGKWFWYVKSWAKGHIGYIYMIDNQLAFSPAARKGGNPMTNPEYIELQIES